MVCVTAGDALRERTLSVTEQLSDNIGGVLASGLRDSLEAPCVLTLDADEDDQRSVGVALVVFDVAGIELRQLGDRRALDRGLSSGRRSSARFKQLTPGSVELQPVTIDQVVRSTVRSMTSVSTRPHRYAR